jgi:hypothetical protein
LALRLLSLLPVSFNGISPARYDLTHLILAVTESSILLTLTQLKQYVQPEKKIQQQNTKEVYYVVQKKKAHNTTTFHCGPACERSTATYTRENVPKLTP